MATYELKNEDRIEKLKPIIEQLPPQNKETLKCILTLCGNIVAHDDKNRMTASNLATVWGPNLINRKEANFYTMKTDLEMGNTIVESLIESYCKTGSGSRTRSSTKLLPADLDKELNQNIECNTTEQKTEMKPSPFSLRASSENKPSRTGWAKAKPNQGSNPSTKLAVVSRPFDEDDPTLPRKPNTLSDSNLDFLLKDMEKSFSSSAPTKSTMDGSEL